jgi:hypothetical protein
MAIIRKKNAKQKRRNERRQRCESVSKRPPEPKKERKVL